MSMVSTTVNGLQGCNAMWLILDYTGAYYAPTVNLTYWETNCRFSSRRDLYISMTLATRYDAQETKRPIFFFCGSGYKVPNMPKLCDVGLQNVALPRRYSQTFKCYNEVASDTQNTFVTSSIHNKHAYMHCKKLANFRVTLLRRMFIAQKRYTK